MSAPRTIPHRRQPRADRGRRSRTCRLSSRPMPAPARPMCWRSASSICCCAASIRRKFSASPSPRPPPPIWRTACSARWPNGPRSTTRRSTQRSGSATGKKADAGQRARARRLFASALETPGGLKVQTIHAFCTRLLHQFPFEANVAARFTVLDEASTTQTARPTDAWTCCWKPPPRRTARSARRSATAIVVAADQTFKDVISDAIRKRDKLSTPGSRAPAASIAAIAELSASFGIDPNDTH